MKFVLTKNVYNGEQLSVEFDAPGKDQKTLVDLAEKAYRLVDHRLLQMNLRVLDGSNWLKLAGKQYPWLYAGLRQIASVLTGAADLDTMPEELPEFKCPACKADVHAALKAAYAEVKEAQ